ncbi:MAG TPA: MarR family transcriptional regulator [Vicinamibacterales bacterium]|nr:MarR family transcriptional regulator [Vicinamibacterales bacterium]
MRTTRKAAAGQAGQPAVRQRVDAGTAARELLHVVMLVMRTVAANMRRSPDSLAPAQMGTLMKVSMAPCTMSALARHLAVSPPTVSKSVDMLVRRGWLERWVDKHDRRLTMVRLTAEGRRVLADIKKRTETHVRHSLSGLTAPEREQLVAVTRMLSRVLVTPGEAEF